MNRIESQKQRCCNVIQAANIIKNNPSQYAQINKSIMQVSLSVFVKFSSEKIIVSNNQTVGDLIRKIKDKSKVHFYYLLLNQKLLNQKDKLIDIGITNGTVFDIQDKPIEIIKFNIQLFQTKSVIHTITQKYDQNYTVNRIKKQILQKCKVDLVRIFYRRKEILKDVSLADLDIIYDDTFQVICSNIIGIHKNTKIKLRNNKTEDIKNLQNINSIISYNPQNDNELNLSHKKYCNLQQTKIKDPIKLQLSNGSILQLTKGLYFYTLTRGWVILSQDEQQHIGIDDQIKLDSGQYARVNNIYYSNNLHQSEMICLQLQGNASFSADQVIISPSVIVQILYRKQILLVNLHQSMEISVLKKKILKITNIPLERQILYLPSNQIWLKDNVKINQIYDGKLIIELIDNQDQQEIRKIKEMKKINIIFQGYTQEVLYQKIKDQTCLVIIEIYLKGFTNLVANFKIFVNNKMVIIDKTISQIINENNENFYYQILNLVIIQFPQSQIIQEISNVYPSEIEESFVSRYMSYVWAPQSTIKIKYMQNACCQQIKSLLNKPYKCCVTQQALTQQFQYISDLATYLKTLSQYPYQCYRCVINTSAQQFKIGSVVVVRQFLSCHKNKETMLKLLKERQKQEQGFILNIRSITGRSIDAQEVVFLPYSYFIVHSCQQINRVNHYYLQEIVPNKVDLRKNIIIWVDDEPQNNKQYIQEWKKQNKDGQVVELTSTLSTKCWLYQFGQRINKLDGNVKIITDMVRYEQKGEEKVANYQAGIDLIQFLVKKHRFRGTSLIYCKDVEKAIGNLQKRGIKLNQFISVTKDQSVLKKYIKFQKQNIK